MQNTKAFDGIDGHDIADQINEHAKENNLHADAIAYQITQHGRHWALVTFTQNTFDF